MLVPIHVRSLHATQNDLPAVVSWAPGIARSHTVLNQVNTVIEEQHESSFWRKTHEESGQWNWEISAPNAIWIFWVPNDSSKLFALIQMKFQPCQQVLERFPRAISLILLMYWSKIEVDGRAERLQIMDRFSAFFKISVPLVNIFFVTWSRHQTSSFYTF